MRPINPRPWGPRRFLTALLILHLAAITIFIHGYLLTRIHLDEQSIDDAKTVTCNKPYKKLVWIVVDALRYDFVISDGRYPQNTSHHHHMPFLSSLALASKHSSTSSSPPSMAFRYIADPPTTTTQRLKSMVSGSLPSFFDISNAFSAQALTEDNLIAQLSSHGQNLSFLGDATWSHLFPTQFNALNLPFPCYNVKDLDTVDDGIWQHLVPTIRQSDSWNVVIAHFLGVDHAGHAHGVDSKRMTDKLKQMDGYIKEIVDVMKQGAFGGGPLEDALLLVSGDHGQTLTGDHGGGSPEEVDSLLVMVDIGKLSALEKGPDMETATPALASEPSCQLSCTCGEDSNQCIPDLYQIDLVPTLSSFLNLPIPFGNLGRFSPFAWSLAADRCGGEEALLRGVVQNVEQVYRYVQTYSRARGARFPRKDLGEIERSYAELKTAFNVNEKAQGENSHINANIDAHIAFLEHVNTVARSVWTQFNDAWMVVGLGVFIGAVIMHTRWTLIAACFAEMRTNATIRNKRTLFKDIIASLMSPEAVVVAAVWAAVVGHALGIFSFFYLLSEGRMACYLIQGVAAVITGCCVVKDLTRKEARNKSRAVLLGGTLLLGIGAITSTEFLARIGLQNHSGFGFWQRLTVHEPADLEREPTVMQWNTAPTAWIVVGKHIFSHVLPTLFGVLYVNRTGFIYPQRLLVSVAWLLTTIHTTFEWATHHKWLPENVSLASLLPQDASITTISTAALLSTSLHLLLPRIIMTLCAAIVTSAILSSSSIVKNKTHSLNSSSTTLGLFAAALVAILPILSNTITPLLFLVFIFQMKVLWMLLVHALRQSPPLVLIATSAGLLSLLQTQAFFVMGHLCEFAGINWTAGFVGYEDFDLVRSGLLVALDTFGGMALVTFTLALIVQAGSSKGQVHRFSKGIKGTITRNSTYEDVLHRQYRLAAVLAFSLGRALACLMATLSAAVQRRHLYAWALFAPKFAFEVFFLICTDIFLLLNVEC